MIDRLSPYPAYKDSGVPWLGKVPAHWGVRRLRTLVEMRVNNLDKHSRGDEKPVRLCNYVDVYKHDKIRSDMNFMQATASGEEIARFRLQTGDLLITKDSEIWNDIALPALVETSAPDLISGYHLALLRPRQVLHGAFLFRAIQSPQVAYQFHVEANGVTHFGLSHSAIKSALVPLPLNPNKPPSSNTWTPKRPRLTPPLPPYGAPLSCCPNTGSDSLPTWSPARWMCARWLLSYRKSRPRTRRRRASTKRRR